MPPCTSLNNGTIIYIQEPVLIHRVLDRAGRAIREWDEMHARSAARQQKQI